MTYLINILNGTGDGFCRFALAMLIQSGILIVLMYLIDLLIRKHVRAVFRYCIWMLILVKLILPPTLCLPTGIGYWYGLDIGPAFKQVTPETPVKVTTQETDAISAQYGLEHLPAIQPIELKSASVASTNQTIPITWQAVVFLIWLVGLLVLSVLLFQRFLFVKSLLAQSDKADVRLDETLQQCCGQVGIRGNIELRLSKNMLSPAACGLFNPVILMPASLLESLSKEKLRAVLIHELAHIKRGDLWVNFLQTLLQIAYFYNPLLWFANAVVRSIREKAVDEMVLTTLGDEAGSYSSTLIDIAEIAFSRPHFSLRLIGVIESKKALTSRIKHILSRPFPKSTELGMAGLVAIFIAGVVLLPMAKAGLDDKYKKVFNNGLTVELVGVHLRNGDNKTWWRPDGYKLEDSIETVDLNSYDSIDPAYEFVFKASGDITFKVESIKGSNVIFGVQVPGQADMTGYRGHIKESVRKTNIEIATPDSEWKTVVKSKGVGAVSGKFKGKTIVLAAAEKAGNDVLISSSDQAGYKYATRLIAVDKSGKELVGKIKTDTGVNNLRQRTIRFMDLDLSDIAEFRFQTCPYEYYTFKNVSLKPTANATVSVVEDEYPRRKLTSDQFSSHTVLNLKTGLFIPKQQADESKEPYLYYGSTFPPGANPSKYNIRNIPKTCIGVNIGNMDLGGGSFSPESESLGHLWSIETIEQLPKFYPRMKITVGNHTSDGTFIHPPLDRSWPYITAFKGDDGTYGVFEVTQVEGRDINVRYKTLNSSNSQTLLLDAGIAIPIKSP